MIGKNNPKHKPDLDCKQATDSMVINSSLLDDGQTLNEEVTVPSHLEFEF